MKASLVITKWLSSDRVTKIEQLHNKNMSIVNIII